MWQHGGVSLSPRGVSEGAGEGVGQEDALGVIFFWINEKHYLQCLLLSFVWLWDSLPSMFSLVFCLTLRLHLNLICLVFVDCETPSDWLWPWVCFSSFFFSLYIYTYAYTYFIIYFLVLTKPVPAWILVKASFSTSDTIETLYRYRSTNRFVSLLVLVSPWKVAN